MNVISIFHSYKFTHYVNRDNFNRTKAPNKLNKIEKFSILIFGVNNSKPKYNGEIPHNFESKKIKSNVEIEIWENIIQNSKGIVLLFHGYSAEKSSLIKNAQYFNNKGYSTIMADFMGSGNSEGNQTTIGYFESKNVFDIFQYASQHNTNIIVYGNSMGAVSIMKAIHEYKISPTKVILECPFGTMQQTVENRFENMKVPSFPLSYLLTFWGGTLNGFWAFDHNPESYAESISQPTLLMYGAKDKNVKRFEIDNIFKNINSKNKNLKIFKNAGHENYLFNYSEEWEDSVSNFINTAYR